MKNEVNRFKIEVYIFKIKKIGPTNFRFKKHIHYRLKKAML